MRVVSAAIGGFDLSPYLGVTPSDGPARAAAMTVSLGAAVTAFRAGATGVIAAALFGVRAAAMI